MKISNYLWQQNRTHQIKQETTLLLDYCLPRPGLNKIQDTKAIHHEKYLGLQDQVKQLHQTIPITIKTLTQSDP